MGGVQKRRTPIVSKLESFYGAGGGTSSGVSDTSACSPNFAAGLTPQATRCETPHCGVSHGFREAARGQVPSIKNQNKTTRKGWFCFGTSVDNGLEKMVGSRIHIY